MHAILALCVLMQPYDDSLPISATIAKKSYGKQVLVNGILSLTFTIGAGVFYTMGNNAYEDYEQSQTIRSALSNYDKTVLYDNLRNGSAIGALFFLSRALYYQFKNIRAESPASYQSVISLQNPKNPKLVAGIVKRF